MYLSALTLGYAVPPRGFEAVVHSGFQSAANLRLAKSGKLLTLVGSGEADLPQGIRLNTSSDFSFTILRVGESVTCRNGFLRIDSISLTIDLTQARVWKCDLPALKVDLANPVAEAAWKTVWQALNQRQRNNGADIVAEELLATSLEMKIRGANPQFEPQRRQEREAILESLSELRAFAVKNITPTEHPENLPGLLQKASEALQALLLSTQRFDPAAASPIRKLIGLGSGLTPAGDDLLAGYLAGLWCVTDGKPERREFVTKLGEKIVRFSRRTNDISRSYLYHAAHGQVSSRLAALAKAIAHGETGAALLTAAENAMRVGHTSGMDAVTGLLLGLAVWENVEFYHEATKSRSF